MCNFLNDVLNVPKGQSLVAVEILNPISKKEYVADKVVILDVKARVVGYGVVNIEIQLANQKNIHKRSLYYGAKLYEGQLEEGENYRRLSRVIAINIIDFQFFTSDAYHSCFRLMEERNYEPYPDLLQLHFFELPKFIKMEQDGKLESQDRMVKWLCFLTNEDDSRWEEMAKQDPIIDKVVNRLKIASLDPEARMQYEAREKMLKDIASIRGDGIEEGIEKGQLIMAQEIAIKMITKGIEIGTIIEFTGLTEKEINDLKLGNKL